MKRLIAACVLLLPWALASAGGADYERTFPTAKGKMLEIDLKTGGSITIAGWAADSVAVQGYREGRDADDAVLEMEATSAGVTLRSRYQHSSRNRSGGINLEIRVPSRYDIRFQTMGGEVRIADVEGTMSGKTMGGALRLTALKGNLDLLTMGGGVTLKKSDVDGSVKTMGGEVVLEDVTGDVRPSSMGGQVRISGVTRRSGAVQGKEVDISTMGGDITVDDAPKGAVLSTMGGAIRVRSAAGFVRAKTMGGEIRLEAVDGAMDATTMGGPVEATMTGDPSTGDRSVALTSMGGNITLSVPASLSMAIDIELAYTEGHEGEYDIRSDFPIAREVSPSWERDHGSPRKIIRGTGTQGGGKNRVTIRTVNGNVILRKTTQ